MSGAAAQRATRLLSLLFFLGLGGAGGFVPYLGLYLERRGLSGAQIGALMASMPLARMVASPLWAAVADKTRMGTRLLQLSGTLATLILVGIFLPLGPVGLGLVLMAHWAVRAPSGPLLDSAAVRMLERNGLDTAHYGRIRLWGSLGFLVVGVAGSLTVTPGELPMVPLALAVCLWALAAAFSFALPVEEGGGPAPFWPALRTLGGKPGIGLFLAAAALHGVALNVYDAFFAVHVTSQGLPGWVIGASIAAGITTEVALLAYGRAVLSRLSPGTLVAVGMAAGALRYGVMAWATAPALVVAVQTLHGLSFGAFWIGGVEWMRRAAPPTVAASAQALFNISGYGLGPVLAALSAGLLLDGAGTPGLFTLGAGCSAVGALLVAASEHQRRRALAAPAGPPTPGA